jgi:hypothetical protein
LSLEIGRDSSISTVSPILDLFSASWA